MKLLFSNCVCVYFAVRGSRPGKNVQLSENEIRGLCLKSREIFLSQPILLELEAPLKVCGKVYCSLSSVLHLYWLDLKEVALMVTWKGDCYSIWDWQPKTTVAKTRPHPL